MYGFGIRVSQFGGVGLCPDTQLSRSYATMPQQTQHRSTKASMCPGLQSGQGASHTKRPPTVVPVFVCFAEGWIPPVRYTVVIPAEHPTGSMVRQDGFAGKQGGEERPLLRSVVSIVQCLQTLCSTAPVNETDRAPGNDRHDRTDPPLLSECSQLCRCASSRRGQMRPAPPPGPDPWVFSHTADRCTVCHSFRGRLNNRSLKQPSGNRRISCETFSGTK